MIHSYLVSNSFLKILAKTSISFAIYHMKKTLDIYFDMFLLSSLMLKQKVMKLLLRIKRKQKQNLLL